MNHRRHVELRKKQALQRTNIFKALRSFKAMNPECEDTLEIDNIEDNSETESDIKTKHALTPVKCPYIADMVDYVDRFKETIKPRRKEVHQNVIESFNSTM